MNHLILDLTDPNVKTALQGCDDGERVEFTVGGTLKKSATAATIELDEVKYTGSDAEGSPAEEAKESPAEEVNEETAESAGKAPDDGDAPLKSKKAKRPPALDAAASM